MKGAVENLGAARWLSFVELKLREAKAPGS